MPRTSPSELRNATAKPPESVPTSTFAPRKTAPENLTRSRLTSHIRSPPLQLDQPVFRFGQNRELGQIPAHHRHLIAAMKSRTSVAVFVDFVGKILALCNRESLPREEIRFAREQANAIHPMALRLRQQRFHQPSAAAFALRPGSDRNRPDLGQMRAIKMQCSTANDPLIIFEDHKVSHVLADLRQSARQQRAVTRVCRNQLMNLLCVRQNCFTRAHGPPREATRPSSW